jgi:hypothetical protein
MNNRLREEINHRGINRYLEDVMILLAVNLDVFAGCITRVSQNKLLMIDPDS